MADLVLTTSVLEETKIQIENTDLILVTIFGENVSLSLVRLRVAQLAKTIEKTFGQNN